MADAAETPEEAVDAELDPADLDAADQEAMAAQDAADYEEALQQAGDDKVEYDADGNLVLKEGVDPQEVVTRPARPGGGMRRVTGTPQVDPESEHGRGNGPGLAGGGTGKRRRLFGGKGGKSGKSGGGQGGRSVTVIGITFNLRSEVNGIKTGGGRAAARTGAAERAAGREAARARRGRR